jgi:hypothetical protein
MVQKIGLPNLFVTLTQNDSWPELKQLLQKYPKDKRATIFNPVDVSEYFFKRFGLVLNEIKKKNGIFGNVEHYWYRVEFQNRGAIHIYMLLWLKEDPVKSQTVCAQIPILTDKEPESSLIKEYVEKYQIHTCRPNRCFMNSYGNKPLLRCKYGFPYKEQLNDELQPNGSGYIYKRTKIDANVVPYNFKLLLLWNGHINVQYVTKRGIELYLVKYISKVEPSLLAKPLQNTNFIKLRVVSSLEAASIVAGHHFAQSNLKIQFLNTCLPDKQFKYIKSKEKLIELEPDSSDIYKTTQLEYYCNRPEDDVFDDITIIHYFERYEIFFNLKTIPIKRRTPLYRDKFNNYVVKRNKEIVIRYRYLQIFDGEDFFF